MASVLSPDAERVHEVESVVRWKVLRDVLVAGDQVPGSPYVGLGSEIGEVFLLYLGLIVTTVARDLGR